VDSCRNVCSYLIAIDGLCDLRKAKSFVFDAAHSNAKLQEIGCLGCFVMATKQ
jgi:hypothetical protein